MSIALRDKKDEVHTVEMGGFTMLVQTYLRDKGLPALVDEFAIKVREHDTLPLVILNYDQIESRPKSHPIVRECRGLVMEMGSWNVVARSFRRFFNWGEMVEEMDDFNFSSFRVDEKVDGSLALLYHYDGEWRFNTRGSFGDGEVERSGITWREIALQATKRQTINDIGIGLNSEYTYVFELVSPYNQVVRYYDACELYLLSAFHNQTGEEMLDSGLNSAALAVGCHRPIRYPFRSIDEIINALRIWEKEDPTFEGVVMADDNGVRYKIKNPAYLSLHKMRGEGENLYNPKHQLPIILAGELDEVLTYFGNPKLRFEDSILLNANLVDTAYHEVERLWIQNWRKTDQKEFALAVKDTRLSSVLFQLKKVVDQMRRERVEELTLRETLTHLRSIWRNSESLILKHVF